MWFKIKGEAMPKVKTEMLIMTFHLRAYRIRLKCPPPYMAFQVCAE